MTKHIQSFLSGKQFDVDDAILNSLAGLEVTLNTDVITKLDDFQTELVFSQFNVPAIVRLSFFFSPHTSRF